MKVDGNNGYRSFLYTVILKREIEMLTSLSLCVNRISEILNQAFSFRNLKFKLIGQANSHFENKGKLYFHTI